MIDRSKILVGEIYKLNPPPTSKRFAGAYMMVTGKRVVEKRLHIEVHIEEYDGKDYKGLSEEDKRIYNLDGLENEGIGISDLFGTLQICSMYKPTDSIFIASLTFTPGPQQADLKITTIYLDLKKEPKKPADIAESFLIAGLEKLINNHS